MATRTASGEEARLKKKPGEENNLHRNLILNEEKKTLYVL